MKLSAEKFREDLMKLKNHSEWIEFKKQADNYDIKSVRFDIEMLRHLSNIAKDENYDKDIHIDISRKRI